MRVAVTGGTGFVGPAIIEELLEAGHDVVALEHHHPAPVASHERLTRVRGDVTDRGSIEKAFAGCDAVIHLVAIINEDPEKGLTFEKMHSEATRNVAEAAMGVGVQRFILMSANGVDDPTMPDTGYLRTKGEMEHIIMSRAFDWTIFRPSFIAGTSGRDEAQGFDDQFAGIVDKFPVLPSFGGGRFLIQPVALKNVAQAFVRALDRPRTHGRTYTLVGPERFSWNEYLRRLARLRGRRRMIATVPRGALLFAADKTPFLFPVEVSGDQLRMLMAGNVGDAADAMKDLDLELIRWERAVEGLRRA